jgi:hypothetical protein
MHVEVVVPTLQLLASDATWRNVEAAYHKAIKEISSTHPLGRSDSAAVSIELFWPQRGVG